MKPCTVSSKGDEESQRSVGIVPHDEVEEVNLVNRAAMLDSWTTTVKPLANELGHSQYHIAVACGSVDDSKLM